MASQAMEMGARSLATRQWEALPQLRYQAHYWQAQMDSLWTLPPDDSDDSTRWMLIKSHFTRRCATSLKTLWSAAPPSGINTNKRFGGSIIIALHCLNR
jgi:hypothetical protein